MFLCLSDRCPEMVSVCGSCSNSILFFFFSEISVFISIKIEPQLFPSKVDVGSFLTQTCQHWLFPDFLISATLIQHSNNKKKNPTCSEPHFKPYTLLSSPLLPSVQFLTVSAPALLEHLLLPLLQVVSDLCPPSWSNSDSGPEPEQPCPYFIPAPLALSSSIANPGQGAHISAPPHRLQQDPAAAIAGQRIPVYAFICTVISWCQEGLMLRFWKTGLQD